MKRAFLGESDLRRNHRGFSLLELVAVIAILAVLAAVALRIVDGVRERSMIARAQSELAALRGALDRYRSHFGSYPIVKSGSGEDRMRRLVRALSGQENPSGSPLALSGAAFFESAAFFIEDGVMLDPWDQPYFFAYDPDWIHGQYFLMSKGPDGVASFPGTDGLYSQDQPENRDNLEGME